jgi:L-lysine 6-transaminase
MQLVETTFSPRDVRPTLDRHILADGMDMVLDMKGSQGVHLRDAVTGRDYLDFFGFYASNALGMNHPKILSDHDGFHDRLMDAALNKVANSDVYTPHMARFVDTFSRVGIPSYLPYAFFVSGGALAVENALKAAFDWKVRKNFQKGYRREVGHKVLHFEKAFHGRTGYTMSLTNTDPMKVSLFPKFDWPRISSPHAEFPLEGDALERTVAREDMALAQARRAFAEHGDEIACVLVEPIQGEGGDNHFRPEFLQALKDLAHENDALLVFDEVQTGVGSTGAFWAHQRLGVEPDIIAFGKKTQVCGILAGRKLEEVDDHVFATSSRINSTWGGNLVDMVRFDRILEIIEEDDLVAHAKETGDYLQQRLREMQERHEGITNARGLGLFCAFDLSCPGYRNAVLKRAFERGLIILGCGTRTIRFRSPLTVTPDQLDTGLGLLEEVVGELWNEVGHHMPRA